MILRDWIKSDSFAYVEYALIIFAVLGVISFAINHYTDAHLFQDVVIGRIDDNHKALIRKVEGSLTPVKNDVSYITKIFAEEISEVRAFNRNAENINAIGKNLEGIESSYDHIVAQVSDMKTRFTAITQFVGFLKFVEDVDNGLDNFKKEKLTKALGTLGQLCTEASQLDKCVKYISKDIKDSKENLGKIEEQLGKNPALRVVVNHLAEEQKDKK